MNTIVRELCLFSIFSSLAASLVTHNGVKRILNTVTVTALLCMIAEPLTQLDFESYNLMAAKYREESIALQINAENISDRLNRIVIEQECEEYINNRAEELGIELNSVKVTARWHRDGLWIPNDVLISSPETRNEKLCLSIEAELGIPSDEQVWNYDR